MNSLGVRSNVFWFAVFFVSLAAVYSATLVYPYLLADEAWIVRPGTASAALKIGRPLFSIMGAAERHITEKHVYLGILTLRVSGLLGLALTARVLMRWLEIWGHPRIEAALLSLSAMTLPAYEIVIADGTQLGLAIFLPHHRLYFFGASGRIGGLMRYRCFFSSWRS